MIYWCLIDCFFGYYDIIIFYFLFVPIDELFSGLNNVFIGFFKKIIYINYNILKLFLIINKIKPIKLLFKAKYIKFSSNWLIFLI
jgi:hypothetical protein